MEKKTAQAIAIVLCHAIDYFHASREEFEKKGEDGTAAQSTMLHEALADALEAIPDDVNVKEAD